MSLKNPATPPGIDPGTVRLVVQRPNHYTTPGPNICTLPLIKPLMYVCNISSVAAAHNHLLSNLIMYTYSWTVSHCMSSVIQNYPPCCDSTKLYGQSKLYKYTQYLNPWADCFIWNTYSKISTSVHVKSVSISVYSVLIQLLKWCNTFTM